MYRYDDVSDSYEAAVMRVIVQPLIDEDLAKFDEYNKIPHEYSDEFKNKLNRLFKREELREQKRICLTLFKKLAVCAMVGSMIILASCAAIKPLREKIANAVVEWYTEYVSVYFEDKSSEKTWRIPSYIPEGYNVAHETVLDDYKFIRYSDANGNLITFTCEPSDDSSTLFDQERHGIEQVDINGISGLYLLGDSESNILTWTDDGYTYSIVGYCDKEELLKIAESLK